MTPIADIQARFRELGRIRLGTKELTGGNYKSGPKKGQPVEKPVKLSNFRLTSPWGHLIEQAAEVFGGEAREWVNDGKKEFEVLTELVDQHGVAYLPVVIPPGDVFSQWYELWDGGGLIHRCDGFTQVAPTDSPCACPADPNTRSELASDGKACKPNSRLRVMLPDLDDMGIWRLESHGFHAATELAGAATLVEMATRQGAMIPAELRLQLRESTRRPGQPRRTFYVPAIAFRTNLGPILESLGVLDPGPRPAALPAAPGPGVVTQVGPGGQSHTFDPASSARPGPSPENPNWPAPPAPEAAPVAPPAPAGEETPEQAEHRELVAKVMADKTALPDDDRPEFIAWLTEVGIDPTQNVNLCSDEQLHVIAGYFDLRAKKKKTTPAPAPAGFVPTDEEPFLVAPHRPDPWGRDLP